MRLEFSSDDSAIALAEDEYPQNIVSETDSDEVLEMLRSGIKAAQSGSRAEARNLLLRVTEADSKNENAWLWLASISEYPEELLVFLNNVLDINPENERAQEWAKATKSLLAKNFVQRGIEADKENRRDFARQCFMQAVVHDSRNEMAWLWLASVADTEGEKNAHLHRVLEINPANETALSSLKPAAKPAAQEQTPLSKANAAALAGDGASARLFLEEVFKTSPETESAWVLKSHLTDSFREKAECFEKILEFNPASELARVNLDFLRAMVETVEPAEEFNPPSEGFEFEDEETSPDSPTEQLFLSPENEAELQSAFAENQAGSEVLEMPVTSSVQPEAETFDFSGMEELKTEENAEESVDVESFHIDAFENPAEDFVFAKPANLFEEKFEENLQEEVSEEYQFGEKLFEDGYTNGTAENSDDCFEIDVSEVFTSGEMAENDYSASFAASEQTFTEAEENTSPTDEAEDFAETDEDNSFRQPEEDFHYPASAAPAACPFCDQENESRAFICQVCYTMLTLSDLEMLLAHEEANRGIVQAAVEELEVEDNKRGLECAELISLGIGHINLKNLRKGLSALQKAAKLDPNNVVLESQVNSLAIRLSEIEEKESTHHAMPVDKTIMVVDDSTTVRKLISGKLEKCGHIVITAVDGMDAMEKLNDVTPDLILLDIAMPRMDGYQVCKLIRNNESTKEIPIVMISGKDGFFDKVRGRMAGTTSYITKPFGPETLMKMLETYLV